MTKKISGAEYQISKIFSSEFDYEIPSYQRPYAWTIDQASELYDDLYDFFRREQEDTYFLGSIVLIKEETRPKAEVIDGQQRLTTLTILLAALTSLFEGELRADFENYIREPGRASQGLKPKPRLALRERDRDFFARYVQSLKLDALLALETAQLDNESQRNIKANTKLMLDNLKTNFADNQEDLCNFGAFIVQRCFLVAVSTPSQQSAFRIFSVLNSRGLDLLPTDIIKSDIIGRIPAAHQAEFTDRWEDLEVEAGRQGFSELFTHIRMIYAKTKARRSLLDDFRDHVISRYVSAEDLVSRVIEPYAEAYVTIKGQRYESTANAELINALFRWLNRIDNSDWMPPAIQFLSQRKAEPEYVLWFFTKLERLAAYLHITAANVNERIDRYAPVLEALEKDHSLSNPSVAVELTADEKEEFLRALDGEIYRLTARRRNYLILRLDSFLGDGAAAYDPTVLTIEHVLPQTVNEGSEWDGLWPEVDTRNRWVHRISNLVPLTHKKNSEAQNFDYTRKKNTYFTGKSGVSSYALTTQVLNTPEWTPEVVEQRQKNLLKAMADKWDLSQQ